MSQQDKTVNKSDYETLAAFRYELRKFLRFSEQAAEQHDLTPQQYLVLLEIRGLPEGEGMTVGALAERLQVTPHNAVGRVNRLEQRGIVRRRTCAQDRRRVYVSLTRTGERILERLAHVHQEELKTVGPLLVKLLTQMNSAVERRPNPPASPVCYADEDELLTEPV